MSMPPELSLLQHILPLAVGAAISPMVLVFQLMVLASGRGGLGRSGAFVLGCGLVVLLWLSSAGWIATRLPPIGPGADPIAAALDGLFAVLLLAIGLMLVRQPRPPVAADQAQPRTGLLQPLLTGLATMGCNLSSLVLFLPAMQQINRSAAQGTPWWPPTLLLVLLTLAPAWLPPALVLAAGQRARGWLQHLHAWVAPRQRGINATVAFALALLLGWRALVRA